MEVVDIPEKETGVIVKKYTEMKINSRIGLVQFRRDFTA
jgi:hypothetical protein